MSPEQERQYHELAHLAYATAGRIARRHGSLRRRLDELEAAALYGLARAVTTWEPGRGLALRTWIYRQTAAAVEDWLRAAEHARRQGRLPEPLSLDALTRPGPPRRTGRRGPTLTGDSHGILDHRRRRLRPRGL